jgi:hypothetical protein
MTGPRTFRTSPGSYAALCGVLSVPFFIWVWSAFSRGTVDPRALLISASLPVAAAVWLAWYRLRIDDSGIEYRDLRRSFYVRYPEVASLKAEWISGGRFGSVHRFTLHLHDGRELPINLKPFPRDAYKALSERLRSDA